MLIPLPFQLPASLPEALGYQGGRRWVALYWEPCGDEARVNDFHIDTECFWWSFAQFTRHPKIRPWLRGYNLGDSDTEAVHWLLCDFQERTACIGTKEEVRAELMLKYGIPQNPPVSAPVVMTAEDMLDFVRNLNKILYPAISLAAIEANMERGRVALGKMTKELDNAAL